MNPPIYSRRAPKQDNLVVPHILSFNDVSKEGMLETISNYLSPDLADGIVIENITSLMQQGFIERANPKTKDLHVGKTGFQIRYTPPVTAPEAVPA